MDRVAVRLGGSLSPEMATATTGQSIPTSVGMLLEDLGSGESVEETTSLLLALTAEVFAEDLLWQPGAEELIDALRAAGIRTALVTNSPRSLVDVALAGLLGEHRFDVTVCGDEVLDGKPSPVPYLTAMERSRADRGRLSGRGGLAVRHRGGGGGRHRGAGGSVRGRGAGGSGPDLRVVPARSDGRGAPAHPSGIPPVRPPHRMRMTVRADGPAAPAAVWDRYVRPQRWSEWSPQIRSVDYPGEIIAAGGTGVVHGPCGVSVRFEIDEVDHDVRRWSWRVKVAGIAMSLGHSVAPAESESESEAGRPPRRPLRPPMAAGRPRRW